MLCKKSRKVLLVEYCVDFYCLLIIYFFQICTFLEYYSIHYSMTICCYGHLVANFFDCPAVLRGPPHLSAMNLCFAFLLGEIYWPIKIIQRFVMERGEGRLPWPDLQSKECVKDNSWNPKHLCRFSFINICKFRLTKPLGFGTK